MSLLVVGLSHRTAALPLLEQAALADDAARELERELCAAGHVSEALVLATCNRVEVYAEVSRFHGGVAEVGQALAAATGIPLNELTDHLYVHYETAAVAHLFSVACGLDSMAIGEQQILGQVRGALRSAQRAGSVGRVIDHLMQQALRVGKRAHTETRLDQAGGSLVSVGLAAAAESLGPLEQARALVVGAGSMSGLVVSVLRRAGVRTITVVNRSLARAERLAATAGGRALPLAELTAGLAEADLVISGTGAAGFVITADHVRAARAAGAGQQVAAQQVAAQQVAAQQVYVDLALPRDIDPAIAELPGVRLVDLEEVGRRLAVAGAVDVGPARALVTEEVEAYLAEQRAEAVAPTVVALRAHARSVVDAELARLDARLGAITPEVRGEIAQAVHRVVEKLLHTPTVRMKELADQPDGASYAEALRALFDLAPERIEAVTGGGAR